MPSKYQTKPTVIEAVLWDGKFKTEEEIMRWADGKAECLMHGGEHIVHVLAFDDGTDDAAIGDWIVKDDDGLWACSAKYFAEAYEPLQAEAAA